MSVFLKKNLCIFEKTRGGIYFQIMKFGIPLVIFLLLGAKNWGNGVLRIF